MQKQRLQKGAGVGALAEAGRAAGKRASRAHSASGAIAKLVVEFNLCAGGEF